MIGIIVDGIGDLKSLKSRFIRGYKIIKTDSPRGHSVSAEQIINNAKKQIRLLTCLNCNKIIILLDFEERTVSYRDFVKSLYSFIELNSFNIPVLAAVPNRMIENWYLSDIAFLSTKKSYLKRIKSQKNYEGKDGKKILKTKFKKGYYYNETGHGPDLFKSIRLSYSRKYSKSFDIFLNLLKN